MGPRWRWRGAAGSARLVPGPRPSSAARLRATNSAAGIINIPPRRWTRRVTRFRSVRVAAWSSSRRWCGRWFQGAASRGADTV